MEPKNRKTGPKPAEIAVIPAADAKLEINEPTKKFRAFKYWADVVKWVVNFVGVCVDAIKEEPFPKKDDYTY